MKKLGQHFLINKNKLQKIAESLDLKENETIIEIGPGHGELTRPMAEKLKIKNKKSKIITIEKDRQFVQYLQKKFSQDKNIEIIHGDALKILPKICSKFQDSRFKIVGNIPYYITGYLLRILGELENKPSLIVLTIQKEVAERICKMNLLAASVQFWAEPEIISYIFKKDFRPMPKVDSAIIKLTTYNLKLKTLEIKNYYKLIKILFKQPRKTILNNLKSPAYAKASTGKQKEEIIKILEALKINPQDRPQNLTIDQIKKLSTLF